MLLPLVALASLALVQGPCLTGERLVPTSVPGVSSVELVRAPTGRPAEGAGCATDESSTDCAFADDDARRVQSVHQSVERAAAVRRLPIVDGGVCVPTKADGLWLRWRQGAVPLGPWDDPLVALGRKQRRQWPAARLEPLEVEVVAEDGGVPDVEVLLRPFPRVVRTTAGHFRGDVLGPVESVSVLGTGPLRELDATVTPLDGGAGTRVEVSAPVAPVVVLRVDGGVVSAVTVHGWSDKALAYDGEFATERTVPVRQGVARLEHLKPDAMGAPRRYVVASMTGPRVGAVSLDTSRREVSLALTAPAVLTVEVTSASGPVSVERTAFLERDAADGAACDEVDGLPWGEQRFGGRRGRVVVRAPPGPRCLRIEAVRGEERRELRVAVPDQPGPALLRVPYDGP